MKIGTKSLLFGAHCVIIHPIANAIAWYKLYGFPWHPALWLAFIVHDWGYWGKSDMDGPDGATHPELGAKIVGFFFGDAWHDFTLLHSRRYAKMSGKEVSQLCVADKFATIIMPVWLFTRLVRATGEIKEYMKPDAALESEEYMALVEHVTDPIEWFVCLRQYMTNVINRTKGSALSIDSFRRCEPSMTRGSRKRR